MSTLTRTPIPVSGYVEKVYFNTDLSIEEVKAILNDAFIEPGVMDIMESLLWSDSVSIDVSSYGADFSITLWSSSSDEVIAIFDSGDNSFYGIKGWNPDITYPLVINSNIEGNEKNEMLSNLCSITPFKDEPVIPEEPLTLDSFLKSIADAIREKKGTAEKINAKNYKSEILSIQTGIEPSGTKYITTTSSVDVTSYAKAQIQSSTLIAENIKKDVSILGVTGSYEGSGGGGSLETCTVSLRIDGPTMRDSLVYYINENQELATETFKSSITIKCLKNSIISTNNGGMGVNTSGSLEVLYRLGTCLVLHVFGDGNAVIRL